MKNGHFFHNDIEQKKKKKKFTKISLFQCIIFRANPTEWRTIKILLLSIDKPVNIFKNIFSSSKGITEVYLSFYYKVTPHNLQSL